MKKKKSKILQKTQANAATAYIHTFGDYTHTVGLRLQINPNSILKPIENPKKIQMNGNVSLDLEEYESHLKQ